MAKTISLLLLLAWLDITSAQRGKLHKITHHNSGVRRLGMGNDGMMMMMMMMTTMDKKGAGKVPKRDDDDDDDDDDEDDDDNLDDDDDNFCTYEVTYEFDFSPDNVEDLCSLFETFDLNGRYENNDKNIPGFEWADLCDDFVPLNQWLCPAEDVVQAGICTHPRPWLNPAIRIHYCGPLLAAMPQGPRRESCETWCTNYVSQDRGDCCNISCA